MSRVRSWFRRPAEVPPDSDEPRDEERARHALATLTGTPIEAFRAHQGRLVAAARDAGLSGEEIDTAINARPELPRPLLPPEREILVALLEHRDFDGRDALLAQLAATYVDGYCGCGCATITLQVSHDAPAAPSVPSPIPIQAVVLDEEGGELGGIIVFLEDGYLASLEIYGWSDETTTSPISPFPPLERLGFDFRG